MTESHEQYLTRRIKEMKSQNATPDRIFEQLDATACWLFGLKRRQLRELIDKTNN